MLGQDWRDRKERKAKKKKKKKKKPTRSCLSASFQHTSTLRFLVSAFTRKTLHALPDPLLARRHTISHPHTSLTHPHSLYTLSSLLSTHFTPLPSQNLSVQADLCWSHDSRGGDLHLLCLSLACSFLHSSFHLIVYLQGRPSSRNKRAFLSRLLSHSLIRILAFYLPLYYYRQLLTWILVFIHHTFLLHSPFNIQLILSFTTSPWLPRCSSSRISDSTWMITSACTRRR